MAPKHSSLRLAALLAAVILSGASFAGALLVPTDAPEWKVSTWVNSDPGKLSDLRGKVVLIQFFQLWCPVSNNFSVPLFKRWDGLYGGREDVTIVSIHTVFEGHDVQTPERLREFVKEWEILHPVGIDYYESDKDLVPVTMERYGNEGTPQVAIVDKFGMLRWSHFGQFDPRPVEHFIDRLLLEKSDAPAPAKAKSDPESKSAGRTSRGAKSAPPPAHGRTAPPARDPSRDSARESSRRPPPQEDSGEEEAKEHEEPEQDSLLSGKYRVTFQQTSKSCGELLPPQTVFADLAVSGGQIVVKFSRRYLEQQELTLAFDGAQSFAADESAATVDRGAEVELQFHVSGQFVPGSEPPELQFEFRVGESGGDGSLDCTIEGTGTAGKAGG